MTADREAFVATYGPLFEHSPWVAEDAYEHGPYEDRQALYDGLVAAMYAASEDRQIALVRAHPELAGKVATVDSEREQSSAGLDRLERDEYETLVSANAAYREKFGFPFVICVRDHDKASILEAAQARVRNDPATELRTALAEIARIAHHRLEALAA
ncbi:MAG TPA: 2-oxo-4-hydroxy-4-carboxy-5-ureidoimidazoline decarboxylase [Solirubrobacteraceae bacterium]|nr:2-oxo-4-hydroxy-4-carboxy-5-ureidoimidazoline decarboxylase [Solirubrobacteraceae bacterium]